MRATRRLSLVHGHVVAAIALALAALFAGCEGRAPKPEAFSLRLRAVSTSQGSVAGAQLWADGRDLGTTSEDGSLHAKLDGLEGQAVALSSACPPTYRTLEPKRRLVLRRVSSAAQPRPALELTLRCEPLERQAALVVRALGPDTAGLPIRVGGETVGQTAADGTAHVVLRVKPHSSLRVQLVTEAHPELLPRNPMQSFEIDDQDEVFLVEQALARAKPRRRVPKAPQRAPAPLLPYRID